MSSIAQQILDRAIELGNEKSDRANEAAQAAQTAAMGFVTLVAPVLQDPTPVPEPKVFIPTTASGVDAALFQSTYDLIINDLGTRFSNYYTTYFPVDGKLMQDVATWLSNAVTKGGSGINAVVEDQIWQRDRDRITRASLAAEDETRNDWSAKGFPAPPGAMFGAIEQLRRDRNFKINDQSRDRAIKTFEQEIENVQFAIKTAIDLRMRAIAAATDYIRALALAPQVATSMATASASAQANLINAATGYYGARLKASELVQVNRRQNADMKMRAGEKEVDGFISRMNLQANTAVAIAQSMGTQAASALNAVNGTAQLIQQIEA